VRSTGAGRLARDTGGDRLAEAQLAVGHTDRDAVGDHPGGVLDRHRFGGRLREIVEAAHRSDDIHVGGIDRDGPAT